MFGLFFITGLLLFIFDFISGGYFALFILLGLILHEDGQPLFTFNYTHTREETTHHNKSNEDSDIERPEPTPFHPKERDEMRKQMKN